MKTKLVLVLLLFFALSIKSQTTTATPKEKEEMPEYPGGIKEMMKFINDNVKYPKWASDAGITGKCFIKFVVLPDGSVDSVRVLKGIAGCPDCDAEGVRVVKLMPKWKPGRIGDKAVPVSFNLPINFGRLKK